MNVVTLGGYLMAAAFVVCGGCGLSSHSCGMHTLTWDNYDGMGSASEARYIFDGIPTGQGLQGFRNALRRIERLDDGSKLLLYPVYIEGSDYSGPNRREPFLGYARELWDVVERKELDFYYSRGVSRGST